VLFAAVAESPLEVHQAHNSHQLQLTVPPPEDLVDSVLRCAARWRGGILRSDPLRASLLLLGWYLAQSSSGAPAGVTISPEQLLALSQEQDAYHAGVLRAAAVLGLDGPAAYFNASHAARAAPEEAVLQLHPVLTRADLTALEMMIIANQPVLIASYALLLDQLSGMCIKSHSFPRLSASLTACCLHACAGNVAYLAQPTATMERDVGMARAWAEFWHTLTVLLRKAQARSSGQSEAVGPLPKQWEVALFDLCLEDLCRTRKSRNITLADIRCVSVWFGLMLPVCWLRALTRGSDCLQLLTSPLRHSRG